MKGNLMILVCFLAGVFVGLGYNYSFIVDCTSGN